MRVTYSLLRTQFSINYTFMEWGSNLFQKNIINIYFVLIILLITSGCSSKIVNSSENDIKYRNEGVKVYHLNNSIVETEIQEQPFQVLSKNGEIRAVISAIPIEKTINTIKNDLISNEELFTIIEEKDDFISFKTNQENRNHIDIFVINVEQKTWVVTFLMPEEDYETNLENLELFRQNMGFTHIPTEELY